MIAALIRWSIVNRFLVLLATVIVTAWGLWAVQRTPLDALPDPPKPKPRAFSRIGSMLLAALAGHADGLGLVGARQVADQLHVQAASAFVSNAVSAVWNHEHNEAGTRRSVPSGLRSTSISASSSPSTRKYRILCRLMTPPSSGAGRC